MNSTGFLSARKKILLASIALLAILLTSGALSTSGAFSYSSASSTPSSAGTQLRARPPTFSGSAGAFLSGPTLVPSVFGDPLSDPSGNSPSVLPSHNPKPADPPSTTVPPTVSCQPIGPGCDTISTGSGGATTNLFGLNAVNNQAAFGYTIEPPDQGLCANNQYVLEILNVGVLQVYSPSKLKPVSGVVSLDSLMGLTNLNWGSGGDVSCLFDYNNGGHWFITEFVSTTPEPFSPFTGCFAAVFDTCREGIAVSVTNNPMGAYNVYFLDPNKVNNDPGVGYLLNDFAKIGNTRDAFLLFYDEFNLNSSTIPASGFGRFGFNGAQEFAFSKNAMEQGLLATGVNVAYENMGTASNLYPIPANRPFQPAAASCFRGRFAGAVCWYQVIPAQTPDPSQYDNNNGGTGFMVGSLDFFGAGDNRIAVFDWTGLSNLNNLGHDDNHGRDMNSGIMFGGQILTSQVTYMDEGAPCPASFGGPCGLAPQKAGPIPLGNNCVAYELNSSDVSSCPESGIATNGDGATQASYANGQLWTAVSTLITQTFGTSSEIHVGATYWAIGTNFGDGRQSFAITNQGYVSASHEDIEFPSIAAADNGQALMAFTLSGNGGPTGANDGGFYPSTAYTMLTTSSDVIHITALGKSPQDGFTEYLGYSSTAGSLGTRPRWGDYSQAIFVPSSGFYFSTEYIQSPNCSDSAFLTDPTCGGTRTAFANWGSSINFLGVSSDSESG